MNKIISIVCTFCLLFLFACGNQGADKTTTNQSPSATEVKNKDKNGKREMDPVQGIIERFEKNNLQLTDEQLEQIKSLGDSFDFTGETRYETRIKYKDFREEILTKVLTEEQRTALKNREGEKKKKEKKKRKQKEMEDEGEAQ